MIYTYDTILKKIIPVKTLKSGKFIENSLNFIQDIVK